MNNNYKGDNSKIADKINNFIQREKERSGNDELPFVDISIVKYISEIARLCHTKGRIGVCAGKAGLKFKVFDVKNITKAKASKIIQGILAMKKNLEKSAATLDLVEEK